MWSMTRGGTFFFVTVCYALRVESAYSLLPGYLGILRWGIPVEAWQLERPMMPN
jgi:hypothetical protein